MQLNLQKLIFTYKLSNFNLFVFNVIVPRKKERLKMQVLNSTSPSFKGYDYIPCLMNKGQIALAEKVFQSAQKSDIYKKADECMVDLVAMPAKDNAIIVAFHDVHNDSYAGKNRNLLKTTFRLTDTKENFAKKQQKLLSDLCNYLAESLNINVNVKAKAGKRS